MATNQTKHYGLNQWELTDSVVMAEFNADNQKVDDALHSILASIPHVCSGSYVGTGTSGADNPNTLELGFAPLFLAIITEDEKPNYAGTTRGIAPWLFIRPWRHTNKFYRGNTTANTFYTYVNWLDNGVSWYAQGDDGNPAGSGDQLNVEGITYHYIAIG